MVALEAWFDEDSDDPTLVNTAAELNVVLDTVTGWAGPNIVQLMIADDLTRGALDIGLDRELNRGVLYYAGGAHRTGCYSRTDNTATPGPHLYYYMRNDREFPADAELPIDVVRRAAHEYMATDGERPTSVDWQPSPW
jgi:hypothetical protein